MPRKGHAARCMVNVLSTNTTNQYRALWITDALLADTFNQFCHSPRRYGSNVPGPLEARRRASKRKNTSLAYGGGAGLPVYDPAVMLGNGSKDRWWRRVEDTNSLPGSTHGAAPQAEQSATGMSSLLPSWLSTREESTNNFDTTDQYSTQLSQQVTDAGGDVSNTTNVIVFKDHINRATTLASIRSALQKLPPHLAKRLDLNEIAFHRLAQLYEQPHRHRKLNEALCDPLLHPPGSSNHLKFVQHFGLENTNRYCWDTAVFPVILHAIRLGLVPPTELQDIILLLPKIHNSLPEDQVNEKLIHESRRVLEAIDHSRVLDVNDLDPPFMRLWYRRLASISPSDTLCNLLWRLRHFSNLSELDLASHLILQTLTTSVQTNHGVSSRFVDWFTQLPADLQAPLTVQVTFKMIAAALDEDASGVRLLEKWSLSLPHLKSGVLQDLPVAMAARSQVSIDSCGLNSAQQLIAGLWAASRLWSHIADVNPSNIAERFTSQQLEIEFKHAFGDPQTDEDFDSLSRVVLTLDTLPLPQKDGIFPILQHFSQSKLITMLGNEKYLDALKQSSKLEYVNLRDNDLVLKAKHNYPHVLRNLAESINTDLELFQATAQILILKNKENFRIVKRLLQYNMQLKFCATQSWRSTLANRETTNTRSDLDPALMLSVIERLVMTFAVTPVITARSSFRHVYNMYQFLHRTGAPIRPVVGRALWHAGVTRYGQTGAPKAQVIWCMAKVREIEGKEVANRLLWSAGFRRTFVRDFIHLLSDSPFTKMPELTGNVSAMRSTPREGDVPGIEQ